MKDISGKSNIVESLTLDQTYHCLSCIALAAACKLFCSGMVTCLQLELVGDANYFCQSCVFSKSIWTPITKQRQREQSTEIGTKVHSNVRGLVKVEIKKGWRYYITFMDNYLIQTHIDFFLIKIDVPVAYKCFKAWCKTQFRKSIKNFILIIETSILVMSFRVIFIYKKLKFNLLYMMHYYQAQFTPGDESLQDWLRDTWSV